MSMQFHSVHGSSIASRTVRWQSRAIGVVLTAGSVAAQAGGLAYVHNAGNNHLLGVDIDRPGTAVSDIVLTGITTGEALVGLDFRAQNGLLYGLGVNATANTGTLYCISFRTGFAGVVGVAGSISFTTDGVTPVDLPDPSTVGYGFDVNPAADRIRVSAGSLNFRINPNTGAPIDGDNGGAVGSVSGVNPDGSINAGTTTISASAYTNNQPNNGGITTLYTLDDTSNMLFIQNPPNVGTQSLGQTVTLGGSPLDFSGINGFDVAPDVNAASNNTPVTSGSAYASLNVGGVTGLYRINLVDAQAAFIGNLLGGGEPIQGLAVQSHRAGIPVIGLSSSNSLVRFNTSNPGTSTSVSITGVTAGERLAAIDFRPQSGQLYALGVNATANIATIYLLDPQTGAASAVGIAGQIAFVDANSAPFDLPDPITVGYGFDFNPTVDRIRVTTASGLNFRVNPTTGAPVDGNVGIAGINPDGDINGAGVAGVGATAYTNSYGQSLSGGVTTLYTLDAVSKNLLIQNPANAGTQTMALPVRVGAVLLDFNSISGFDIPASIMVSSSAAPASGFAIAALTVTGVSTIFRIDLATGNAVSPGAAPVTLAGLTLADAVDRMFADGFE